MFPALEVEDFLNTLRIIEGLKRKEIRVTTTDGLEAFDTFRGYDIAAVELENLTKIRMQLSMPQLSAVAMMGSTVLVDSFNIEGVDELRDIAHSEFGKDIWPNDQPLTMPILMDVLNACEEAIEHKKLTVSTAPKTLRWEFEENSLDKQIAAIKDCDIIQPYKRLQATLIGLAEQKTEQALIELKTVQSFEEFRNADEEVEKQGLDTPLDQEIKFEFPMP